MTVTAGPPDTSGITYHLWLKPHGAAHNVLDGVIRALARKLDGPVFEPHLTLLERLDGTEQEHLLRAEQLARQLTRIPISLTGLRFGDEYFRSLYMLVDPSPPVMSTRVRAARAFQRVDDPYLPHVSLLYGVCPEARRTEILSVLPSEITMPFDARALFLIRAASTDPRDWLQIGEFPFAGST
jgi:hypothetical protein